MLTLMCLCLNVARKGWWCKNVTSTANPPTNIVDFGGFDSSIILISRGGIPRPIGDFPQCLSQAMLVGIMSVGRLGVQLAARWQRGPEHHGRLVADRIRAELEVLLCHNSNYVYIYIYIYIHIVLLLSQRWNNTTESLDTVVFSRSGQSSKFSFVILVSVGRHYLSHATCL